MKRKIASLLCCHILCVSCRVSYLPTQSNAPLTTEPLFDGTGINQLWRDHPDPETRAFYSVLNPRSETFAPA
jgi:hypothetical protein